MWANKESTKNVSDRKDEFSDRFFLFFFQQKVLMQAMEGAVLKSKSL